MIGGQNKLERTPLQVHGMVMLAWMGPWHFVTAWSELHDKTLCGKAIGATYIINRAPRKYDPEVCCKSCQRIGYQQASDQRSVIAVNLEFLEQLAWKAWRDGWRDAGGSDLNPADQRASFNIWWGWQAATLEHGDWKLDEYNSWTSRNEP